jgi:hypothetical protein
MSTRLLGTVRASVRDFRWLFRQASVQSEYLYWTVHADRIEAYSLSPVAKRRSYSEFNRFFLSDIDLRYGSELNLLIDAAHALNALKMMKQVSPTASVRIEILGDTSESGEIQNSRLRLQRDLTWQAYVTTVEIPEVLNKTRDRFTDYGYLDVKQADPYRVTIRTPVSEIETLISFMDDKFEKGLYAIDVRDEQLGLSHPEEYGLGSVVFRPYSVQGPDTRKYFTEEFRRVFDRLNGDVLMHLDPEGRDLAVVHTDRKGAKIRHAIESIGVNGKLTLRDQ